MKVQIVFAHALSKSPHAPFGNKNSLPWKHNKEDLSFFKRITSNSVLVMGSKTFESLPDKLVGRPHIVLSRSDTATTKSGKRADFYTSMSFSDLIEYLNIKYGREYEKISVIGGPDVIMSALQYASCIYKTVIVENIEAYDVTIDLTKVYYAFPRKERLEIIECENGSVIFTEKLTKGDI